MSKPITVIDLCSDPLCGNEATHTMISRVPGHRTKVCANHLAQVQTAAEKAGLGERVKLLDIRPIEMQS
jgi:hypothetical protein